MNVFYGDETSLLIMRIGFLIVTMLYITDLVFLVPKYNKCKYDHTPRKQKLMWKGACIGVPLLSLLCGTAINMVRGGVSVSEICMLVAMCLCAAGDIVIEIKFFKGGVLFACGHFLYVSALFMINKKITVLSIVIFLILAIGGTVLTIQKLSKKYRPYLIGYNLMISCTFALSVPLILTGTPALICFGIGGCFLTVSDWLLAHNKVYKSSYGWSLLSLMLYFGGQILISAYPYLK